jgi:hypothetical protein
VQDGLLVILVQGEDYAELVRAAESSGAVKVPRRIPEQPCLGASSVRPASESIENGFLPAFAQSEHGSPSVRPSDGREAVEIPGAVAYQAGMGKSAIALMEAVQHRFLASLIKLVHSSTTAAVTTRTAAFSRGPIKVACIIQDYGCFGICSVRPSVEAVEHALAAIAVYLKYCPIARISAGCRCAIKCACGIANHACEGQLSVGSFAKSMQHGSLSIRG